MNFLSGSVAVFFDALRNCPFLSDVYLSNNSFSGNLSHAALHSCERFWNVDMSMNQIRGEIPRAIGNCSNLLYLDLSKNYLSGSIPRQLGNLWQLSSLDLSSNNLLGALPVEIGNLSSWLMALSLSNNSLSFHIPASLGNLQSLAILALHSNKFNGGLPAALQNCSSLRLLDLSNNQLSGAIPEWIKGEYFPRLQILMLSNNNFRGSTPVSVSSLVQNLTKLQILGLACNYLSGSISSNVNRLEAMTHAASDDPYGYVYAGLFELGIPMKGVDQLLERSTIFYVTALDLSSNLLEGEIPAEIGVLKGLYSLNLSHNLLNGSIPRSLGELGGTLESLDLSNNKLTGGILPELCSGFSFLQALNLANNRLQGAISQSCAHLCTFNASFYAGNDGLRYECDSRQITQDIPKLPQPAPSYRLHSTLIAKLQERVSLAGWGIGHVLGFLLMGLFLHHRARINGTGP